MIKKYNTDGTITLDMEALEAEKYNAVETYKYKIKNLTYKDIMNIEK